MARMHRIVSSFIPLAALVLTVGCVPQEKYNAARLALEAANERFASADAQAKAATAESDVLRSQLQAIMANSNNQGGLVGNLTQQLTELQGRYAKLEGDFERAMQNTGVIQVLPEAVSSALTEFAKLNPDLVDFDASRGIVKFKSDVTFNTGSADVRSDARTAIARFAEILNSPAASGYELQIAGHTDSQRVSSQATKSAGHHDNWYLSSHRAISVGKELQNQRVDARRIAVVGYADQHPIASNASEAGRSQNRRVEVVILPSQIRTAGASVPAGEENAQPAAAKRGGEINKDTTGGSAAAPANK
jgi:chemotaxis protein MotB